MPRDKEENVEIRLLRLPSFSAIIVRGGAAQAEDGRIPSTSCQKSSVSLTFIWLGRCGLPGKSRNRLLPIHRTTEKTGKHIERSTTVITFPRPASGMWTNARQGCPALAIWPAMHRDATTAAACAVHHSRD
ncbi:uncharacterized protein PG998_004306 [Apiospora kogelbergensis]|uniref:uncharacterized protein n=1 Tax=Apiospora kogelbergensis TaxID=1337665 RepID=UPI00312EB961